MKNTDVTRIGLPAVLLAVAAAGWWWSADVAGDMSGGDMGQMGGTMPLGAFVVAWVAMMAAMMFPAILPAVKLYARAAPASLFVAGYLAVWTVLSLPAYLAWRALEMPLAMGDAWAGRVAGVTLVVAGLWQLSPLKSACLQHCRSPRRFIRRMPASVNGAAHGAYCVGCCWALFAVLVAVASMSLVWLVVFTGLIVIERNTPDGDLVARAAGPLLAGLGVALLITPSFVASLA